MLLVCFKRNIYCWRLFAAMQVGACDWCMILDFKPFSLMCVFPLICILCHFPTSCWVMITWLRHLGFRLVTRKSCLAAGVYMESRTSGFTTDYTIEQMRKKKTRNSFFNQTSIGRFYVSIDSSSSNTYEFIERTVSSTLPDLTKSLQAEVQDFQQLDQTSRIELQVKEMKCCIVVVFMYSKFV